MLCFDAVQLSSGLESFSEYLQSPWLASGFSDSVTPCSGQRPTGCATWRAKSCWVVVVFFSNVGIARATGRIHCPQKPRCVPHNPWVRIPGRTDSPPLDQSGRRPAPRVGARRRYRTWWCRAFNAATTDEANRLLEQVKHREQNLTLRTPATLEALDAVEHSAANPKTQLRFCFTTNAAIGVEQACPFPDGFAGIELWERVRRGELSEPDR